MTGKIDPAGGPRVLMLGYNGANNTGAEALLVTSTPGYLLRVDGGSVDADRFECLAGAGRRALAAR